MKITVVTSSRADWNSTGMVVKALQKEWPASVSILVIAASGPAFDALKMAMAEDGVITGDITWASLNLTKDDPVNLANAAGKACSLAGEAFYTLKPDLVFLPGDRWEIAQVAFAAFLAGIPIAHLGGGDKTAGSMDDAFRDCISRMAVIHFTTNEKAHERLSWHGHIAHLVGSPSIDRIKATELNYTMMDYTTMCWRIWGRPEVRRPIIVVNWQSETKTDNPNKGLRAIIHALPTDSTVVFITANDEIKSSEITTIVLELWDEIMRSFSPRDYLSLLKHCDLLIGTSSSGLYEAPYLRTPVVNVGKRQAGRMLSQTIHNASCEGNSIKNAISLAMMEKRARRPDYFYGDGTACEKIVKALKAIA